ncbi:MAG: Lactose-binding protein precursor [Chloroflexi bacterium ADurb.Bin325]|nr:MAG: Lactose-binding protein precursor [Chloroflexi bacterium ADurb.Bin325]
MLPNNSRKLSRRRFLNGALLVGASAGASAALAGCAQPAAAPSAPAGAQPAAEATVAPAATGAVNLRFITNHGAADEPLFVKVVDNFMAANPDITIERLDIAGEEFYNSINTQGAGGQLPDVWYTRTFDVPVYASKGWTISLQPFVERDAAEVDVDDFWPAEVAQMKWKGELWALPYDFSNIGIYYNKNWFDDKAVAYPANDEWKWDELLQLGLNFIEKDGDNFKTWALDLYTWDWVFMGILFGWGGKVYSDDFKESLIDSAENLDALKWFVASRDQGLYPQAGAAPAGIGPFQGAIVPMAFQGSWATVQLRSEIADKFDFDCLAMPKSPSGEPCINAAGGAWGISRDSKDPEAAWKFMKYLASTEGTNILISEPLRSIPGRKSSALVWNETAEKGGLPPKNVAVFSKQMEGAHAAPYPPYWRDYSNAWGNIIVPTLNGSVDEDPAETLKAFNEELTRIIEQNQDSLG